MWQLERYRETSHSATTKQPKFCNYLEVSDLRLIREAAVSERRALKITREHSHQLAIARKNAKQVISAHLHLSNNTKRVH